MSNICAISKMVDFIDNCEPQLDRNDNSWPGKAGEISSVVLLI